MDEQTVTRRAEPLYAQGPVSLHQGLAAGSAAPENEAISVYRGLPYAAPPVGELRWRPPQPAQAWTGIRDATRFSPACPQPDGGAISLFGVKADAPMDEDCLYLNIWTPAQSPEEKLPVMVWIHGGGFRVGSADNPMYNGVNMARAGVVLVSFNYRMNVLGMFAHPGLSAESGHGASGNYAFMDQIAALRWVQDNIAAFGGDPDNVTIFGESAGSRSIALLTVAPQARGLFHRGICQSGALRDVSTSLAEREAKGLEIAAALGCDKRDDPVAALRAQPWRALHDAAAFDSNPIIDGWVVPEDARTLHANGDFAKVPLIIGINADEATMLQGADRAKFDTAETFAACVRERYGAGADAVLAAYPAAGDTDAFDTMMALLTDQRLVLPARRHARWLRAAGVPCYFYFFTRVPPWRAGETMGAHHGAEIAYHFGGGVRCGHFDADANLSAVDRGLSEAMMGYWTNFAATGNPNGPGLPVWPAYELPDERYIELGDEIRVAAHLRKARIDILDGLTP